MSSLALELQIKTRHSTPLHWVHSTRFNSSQTRFQIHSYVWRLIGWSFNSFKSWEISKVKQKNLCRGNAHTQEHPKIVWEGNIFIFFFCFFLSVGCPLCVCFMIVCVCSFLFYVLALLVGPGSWCSLCVFYLKHKASQRTVRFHFRTCGWVCCFVSVYCFFFWSFSNNDRKPK